MFVDNGYDQINAQCQLAIRSQVNKEITGGQGFSISYSQQKLQIPTDTIDNVMSYLLYPFFLSTEDLTRSLSLH